MTGYASDTVPREKLDNMGMEYAYLLTSQLESQRTYFEEQLERAVDKAADAASSADDALRSVALLSTQFGKLQSQYTDALSTIAALEKESLRNAQKAASASNLARTLTKQYKEEQTINESLMERIRHLERKAEEANKKMHKLEETKQDLEEQNRDLGFFISGQEKLKALQDEEGSGLLEGEVEGGMLEVGEGRRGKKERDKAKGKGKRMT